MTEIAYIYAERIQRTERMFKEIFKYPEPLPVDVDLGHIGFNPFVFPDRKGEPVIRRRTRAEIRALIDVEDY